MRGGIFVGMGMSAPAPEGPTLFGRENLSGGTDPPKNQDRHGKAEAPPAGSEQQERGCLSGEKRGEQEAHGPSWAQSHKLAQTQGSREIELNGVSHQRYRDTAGSNKKIGSPRQ